MWRPRQAGSYAPRDMRWPPVLDAPHSLRLLARQVPLAWPPVPDSLERCQDRITGVIRQYQPVRDLYGSAGVDWGRKGHYRQKHASLQCTAERRRDQNRDCIHDILLTTGHPEYGTRAISSDAAYHEIAGIVRRHRSINGRDRVTLIADNSRAYIKLIIQDVTGILRRPVKRRQRRSRSSPGYRDKRVQSDDPAFARAPQVGSWRRHIDESQTFAQARAVGLLIFHERLARQQCVDACAKSRKLSLQLCKSSLR